MAFFLKKKYETSTKSSVTSNSSPPLQAGDKVRVRTLEEIKSTLNEEGKYERGLTFIDEMAQYCGKNYRVLKRVNKVFDSYDWRMKKAHNMVILDGVFCHGYGEFKDCDRSCFFFWKDAWLEKIE